jgi:hypothetical protein
VGCLRTETGRWYNWRPSDRFSCSYNSFPAICSKYEEPDIQTVPLSCHIKSCTLGNSGDLNNTLFSSIVTLWKKILQRAVKMTQIGLTSFKVYFSCPTVDCVQLTLKDVSSVHALQFKLEGRKSDSYPLIELANRLFCEIFELYLDIPIRVSYQKL